MNPATVRICPSGPNCEASQLCVGPRRAKRRRPARPQLGA